ncbi:hypothetical protein [Staphylococcus phage PMBT8]|nr:hypothetical protein [Staphylococcus phage PMBT8]
MNKKTDDMIGDILTNDLLRVQWRIYELTLKYDGETTIENYQDKSIEILNKLSWVDRMKMRWYSERTKLILHGMANI